jgi:hypothetical protein
MKYFVIANPGVEGFITHADNALAHIAEYPGNVFVTENEAWAARVGAVEKTKAEAQAIVDAIIDEAKANFVPNENEPNQVGPQDIVLP